MISKNFIFSEKRSDRIKRHLLFWFCYWVYFTVLHGAQSGNRNANYFGNIPYSTVEAFLFIVPQVFFAYALLSFVLPKYLLKGKYVFAFLWLIVFMIIAAFINFCMMRYFNRPIMEAVLPEKYLKEISPTTTRAKLYVALMIAGKGTLVAAVGACSIRLVKYWHMKEKRNLELFKEKTEAQLQLLTAQVHPHFLFNTLNNIYSKAQNESPGSAKMIMELSHILRYVLDEGKHELVPLEKELQMLTDYINLEKIRYDEKLELHLSLPSRAGEVYIAPLLLLPFVENCFKHGASKMLRNPWINLKIDLQGTTLFMKLMNGKRSSQQTNNGRKGTGIENVKKRLELLYKGKHDLQINEDEEVFVVNLSIELVKMDFRLLAAEPKESTKEYA